MTTSDAPAQPAVPGEAAPRKHAPVEYYGEQYFRSLNYARRSLGRFSMYWWVRRAYAAMIRRYHPQGGKLLEVGCGLGHFLGNLQDHFDVYGADLALYSIQQTRINAPKAKGIVASAERLEIFPDATFDVVAMIHLLEHLEDPRHTIEQTYRILKPGGLFFYTTPNPDYALRHRKQQPDAISIDPTHISVEPVPTWYRWTRESGFTILKTFGDGLWDVPYFPVIPSAIQLAILGLPAAIQVLTCLPLNPVHLGVNLGVFARK